MAKPIVSQRFFPNANRLAGVVTRPLVVVKRAFATVRVVANHRLIAVEATWLPGHSQPIEVVVPEKVVVRRRGEVGDPGKGWRGLVGA